MLLPRFEYHQPRDLSEALEVLGDLGPGARVLAGGTDLLVDLKTGDASAEHLVAVDRLAELKDLDSAGGSVEIGPGVTASLLASRPRALAGLSALAQAAATLGSPQIRNRATLGGNLCSARAAGDLIPPLLVYGATLVVQSSRGARQVSLDDFLLGGGKTVMEPGEMLSGIMLDALPPMSGNAFMKLGVRRAMEIARVSAATSLTLAGDGETIARAKVALGAVGPRALLSPKAEEVLLGQKAGEELFATAGEAAVADASPRTCHEFKCEVVAVLTRRCLMQSWAEARGAAS